MLRGGSVLETLLRKVLLSGPNQPTVHGAVESDSIAMQFPSAREALDFGIALFRQAFTARFEDGTPVWIRGVVVPSTAPLRTSHMFDPFLPSVERFVLSRPLVRAITTEKAGYHGMRLLAAQPTVAGLRNRYALTFSGTSMTRFRRLDGMADSRELSNFREVLWMWSDDNWEWDARRSEMDKRLLAAGRNADEFVQAAATELVFKRCEELVRNARRASQKARGG